MTEKKKVLVQFCGSVVGKAVDSRFFEPGCLGRALGFLMGSNQGALSAGQDAKELSSLGVSVEMVLSGMKVRTDNGLEILASP